MIGDFSIFWLKDTPFFISSRLRFLNGTEEQLRLPINLKYCRPHEPEIYMEWQFEIGKKIAKWLLFLFFTHLNSRFPTRPN